MSNDVLARLDEIRARAEAATKAPWIVRSHDTASPATIWYTVERFGGMEGQVARVMRVNRADAAFIAAARQDIPDLLAAVTHLQAERDHLAGERDELTRQLADAERRCIDTEAAAREQAARRVEEVRREALEECRAWLAANHWSTAGGRMMDALAGPPAAPGEVSRG